MEEEAAEAAEAGWSAGGSVSLRMAVHARVEQRKGGGFQGKPKP